VYASMRVLFIIKYLSSLYDYTILDLDLTCMLLFNFLITAFLMYKYVLLLSRANLVCLKSLFNNKLTFATSLSSIKVNKRFEFTMFVCVLSPHT